MHAAAYVARVLRATNDVTEIAGGRLVGDIDQFIGMLMAAPAPAQQVDGAVIHDAKQPRAYADSPAKRAAARHTSSMVSLVSSAASASLFNSRSAN